MTKGYTRAELDRLERIFVAAAHLDIHARHGNAPGTELEAGATISSEVLCRD